MAKLLLSPEDQLQRLNELTAEVQTWRSKDADLLVRQPAPGKWSVIEIVDHLNAIYRIYRDRIEAAVSKIPAQEEQDNSFRARWFPSLIIKMTRPQNGQRKWQMKTLSMFEPEAIDSSPEEQEVQAVFDTFFDHQDHLRQSILDSRGKDVRRTKVISSIGPILRFYLPECFDFILSHEERHMVQAREVLEKVRTESSAYQ